MRATNVRPRNPFPPTPVFLVIDLPTDGEPVAETAEAARLGAQAYRARLDAETLAIRRREARRAQERDARRALALRVVAAGYKTIARELHPDAGGSVEAMARLNTVRTWLRRQAEVGVMSAR